MVAVSLSCIFTIAAAGCFGDSRSEFMSFNMLSNISMMRFNDFPLTEIYYDCEEALNLRETCSGVYTIKPDKLPPFDVSN